MRVCRWYGAFSSIPEAKWKSIGFSEFVSSLQMCGSSKSLSCAKQVHQQMFVYGLEVNVFLSTKLMQVYGDCDDLMSVWRLFERLRERNKFAWTALIGCFSRHGMFCECVKKYCKMKLSGVLPDGYVFPKVLRACGQLTWLDVGNCIHKDVFVYGCDSNMEVCNSLVDMYGKCGDVQHARQVFDEMTERDLLSWNSMISSYVTNGLLGAVGELVSSMKLNGFEPDIITWNMLMDVYCQMGLCDEAWKTFQQIKLPTIISWTTLILGYSRIGKHEKSLSIFKDMLNNGAIKPDMGCLSCVLVSCRYLGALRNVKEIHAYGIKMENPFTFYSSAGPALLTMYAKCSQISYVRSVFMLMDKTDVVTWNAMIVGYVDLGLGHLALQVFIEMQKADIKNDQTTISTVLPVCDLKSGKQIHAYIRKGRFDSSVAVWNALINMYSKCGCIEYAKLVFSSMAKRDLITWNTIIGGFGMHGLGEAALQFLKEMNYLGVRPNSMTFTSVLSACSHSGLVNEGLELFHRMTKDFGVTPCMEHFACIVDMLARAGRLKDAVNFICKMPLKPDKCIWGTLLSASQAYQNVDIGKLAAEQLTLVEPECVGHYVTLSNIYAKTGKWEDANKVRKQMKSRGLIKPSGQSWIEI